MRKSIDKLSIILYELENKYVEQQKELYTNKELTRVEQFNIEKDLSEIEETIIVFQNEIYDLERKTNLKAILVYALFGFIVFGSIAALIK
ncbi:MAG: hypothetical protein RR598_11095 [Anaerorhabdus sp.]